LRAAEWHELSGSGGLAEVRLAPSHCRCYHHTIGGGRWGPGPTGRDLLAPPRRRGDAHRGPPAAGWYWSGGAANVGGKSDAWFRYGCRPQAGARPSVLGMGERDIGGRRAVLRLTRRANSTLLGRRPGARVKSILPDGWGEMYRRSGPSSEPRHRGPTGGRPRSRLRSLEWVRL